MENLLSDSIPALVPRDDTGHQFVLLADACSGHSKMLGPDFNATIASNFAGIAAMIQRLEPAPEFLCFAGDAVWGYQSFEADENGLTCDKEDLRAQWQHFLHEEMAWATTAGCPVYYATSNHQNFNPEADRIFPETFPEIPRNGPPGLEGLAYWVRRGNLLLVFLHAPDGARHLYEGRLASQAPWLEEVLRANADAKHKIVIGHYPIFPVDGGDWAPNWRMWPDEGAALWDVTRANGVTAFLCAHVLAFDAQVHDGVLQICSAGAGFPFKSLTDTLHVTQIAVDDDGLRFQVLDMTGSVRESITWPPQLGCWTPLEISRPANPFGTSDEEISAVLTARAQGGILKAPIFWRFRGVSSIAVDHYKRQTLLTGWDFFRGPADVWIGFEGTRLVVELVPEAGRGPQHWLGPVLEVGAPFSFEIGLHPDLGPGGVLFRADESQPWSSLPTASARGAEILSWPNLWAIGHRQSGTNDTAFEGKDLQVEMGT
ncbi:MAG TPA: hypothetical protein VF585_10625 [Chthoniobacterales bacterium]|jgi:hypothetical protein